MDECKSLEHDLTEAVRVCHTVGVIHRDIAIRNVLWNDDSMCFVLCDFSESIIVNDAQQYSADYEDIEGILRKVRSNRAAGHH
tara:strand:+ start:288 stop:536 length:249 start_codon:yes stop_codon:yes gene_type:complete